MDAIQDIVLPLHAINRWLVVAVGLVAALKFVAGWLQQQTFGPAGRGLMSAFSGLLDLQVLLGLILLLGLGVNMARIEHAVTMIVAVVLVHLRVRWRQAPDAIRIRNNFLVAVVALALTFVGVAVLAGGSAA
jgi:uncharacterized membrane protein YphA (DoxX/SURF4 family)